MYHNAWAIKLVLTALLLCAEKIMDSMRRWHQLPIAMFITASLRSKGKTNLSSHPQNSPVDSMDKRTSFPRYEGINVVVKHSFGWMLCHSHHIYEVFLLEMMTGHEINCNCQTAESEKCKFFMWLLTSIPNPKEWFVSDESPVRRLNFPGIAFQDSPQFNCVTYGEFGLCYLIGLLLLSIACLISTILVYLGYGISSTSSSRVMWSIPVCMSRWRVNWLFFWKYLPHWSQWCDPNPFPADEALPFL